MLPDSTKLKNNSNIAKFGDTGIKELYKQVVANGASPRRIVAKIAGGAKMFEVSGLSQVGNVGERNSEEAKIILKELRNIGIRPNERPPDVTVNRRRTGGVHVSSTVPLTHLDEKTIRSIINEYGMHNADVLFRDDVTMDQFIDVLDRNKSYVPMLILLNKVDLVDEAYLEEMKKQLPEFIPISADKKLNIDNLKETIFENLNLVRVYLKPQGRKADMNDPLVIKKGSTVIDACDKLHKEFVKNFRHAKIWGTSVKFPGQKVGPDHVLEDEDVLRIILKK